MWVILLGACTAHDDDDDDRDHSAADVAPSVVGVEPPTCFEAESAGEVWQAAFTVVDPQGEATVHEGTLAVLDGTTELATYPTMCSDGLCSGSFREVYDGIACSFEGTFRFVVTDEDGNASAPYDQPV